MIDNQQLSITTGSLDRLEPLRRSLATWLDSPAPDEIVIVDWGNEIPLQESLREFSDPRIIIARAEDQVYWQNSKCHNLELQLASNPLLLRLDNDCLLKPAFFEQHMLQEGCFFAGNWRPVPTEDKRNLSGTLYIHTAEVLAIHGYNERLIHYGYEDDDLYDRLVAKGLKRHDVNLSTLEHIPHPDQQRYARLKIAPQLSPLRAKTSEQTPDEIASAVRQELVQMSEEIAINSPWTSMDHMTRWQIEETSPNRLRCREIPKDTPS